MVVLLCGLMKKIWGNNILVKNEKKRGKSEMIIRVVISILIGSAIGGLLGYYGRCTSGMCPLTSTPLRGAIYGGFLGLLFGMIS